MFSSFLVNFLKIKSLRETRRPHVPPRVSSRCGSGSPSLVAGSGAVGSGSKRRRLGRPGAPGPFDSSTKSCHEALLDVDIHRKRFFKAVPPTEQHPFSMEYEIDL